MTWGCHKQLSPKHTLPKWRSATRLIHAASTATCSLRHRCSRGSVCRHTEEGQHYCLSHRQSCRGSGSKTCQLLPSQQGLQTCLQAQAPNGAKESRPWPSDTSPTEGGHPAKRTVPGLLSLRLHRRRMCPKGPQSKDWCMLSLLYGHHRSDVDSRHRGGHPRQWLHHLTLQTCKGNDQMFSAQVQLPHAIFPAGTLPLPGCSKHRGCKDPASHAAQRSPRHRSLHTITSLLRHGAQHIGRLPVPADV